MRLVIQRVTRAEVRVAGERIGRIGPGAVVLAGVARGDDPETVDRMAERVAAMRYFPDAAGTTNLAIGDADGALLVVSQFTLVAETRRGRRPSFTAAAPPDVAEAMIERFVARLRGSGLVVETGSFGAMMELELVNDGPFTLILDSARG